MTGRPELHTPDGLPETPRARAIRAIGNSTELDAAYVAATVHIGDQVGRLADELPDVLRSLNQLSRIADHLPEGFAEAFHHLDQATAAAADIAHAVERLYPSEELHE